MKHGILFEEVLKILGCLLYVRITINERWIKIFEFWDFRSQTFHDCSNILFYASMFDF